MTIFYQDDAMVVSSTGVEVDGRRYELDELGYVWHRRSNPWRRRIAVFTGSWLTLLAVGLAVLGTAAGGLLIAQLELGRGTPVVVAGFGLFVMGMVGVAGFAIDPAMDLLDRAHDRGRGVHEIWARVDGRDVQIFSTPDASQFGRAYRGLRRAFENAEATVRATVRPALRPGWNRSRLTGWPRPARSR